MKLVIEPERLKKLLNQCLIHKSKSLLEVSVAEFSEKGMRVRDVSLDVLSINAAYSPKYFIEYKVPKKEDVPLTDSLLEALGWGFGDDEVKVITDKNDIIIQGKIDKYKETLQDLVKSEFPIEMGNTDIGIMPKKIDAQVQVQLPAEELSLPSAERYSLKTEDNKLVGRVEDTGEFTKKFKISKKKKFEEISVEVEGEFFEAIVSNLYGNVWITISPDVVVFSQKEKDYLLTYMLSTLE